MARIYVHHHPALETRKQGTGGAFRVLSKAGHSTVIFGPFSTIALDRDKDIILPEAFRETLTDRPGEYLPVVQNHDAAKPSGHTLEWGITKTEAWARAQINDPEARRQVESGDVRAFSWYGYILDWREPSDADFLTLGRKHGVPEDQLREAGHLVLRVDLIELTLTPTPCNPHALFTVEKSDAKRFGEAAGKAAADAVLSYLGAARVTDAGDPFAAAKAARRQARQIARTAMDGAERRLGLPPTPRRAADIDMVQERVRFKARMGALIACARDDDD
jgi:hypothetical protein